MQEEVNPVVSGRMFRIAKNRIVEQIGKRRDRAIKTALKDRPPVRMFENQVEIRPGRLLDARIMEYEGTIIERESATE